MYEGGPPRGTSDDHTDLRRALADQGLLVGRVLDIGCGTGEHALMAAARGWIAAGTTPFQRQSAKHSERRRARSDGAIPRRGRLRLADLGEQFDTVLDSGLFHIFSDGSPSVRRLAWDCHLRWRSLPTVLQ